MKKRFAHRMITWVRSASTVDVEDYERGYVTTLPRKTKWSAASSELKLGSLVFIRDKADQLPNDVFLHRYKHALDGTSGF